MIAGDINESFNLLELDIRKSRFEPIGADLALRSLYKGINNILFLSSA